MNTRSMALPLVHVQTQVHSDFTEYSFWQWFVEDSGACRLLGGYAAADWSFLDAAEDDAPPAFAQGGFHAQLELVCSGGWHSRRAGTGGFQIFQLENERRAGLAASAREWHTRLETSFSWVPYEEMEIPRGEKDKNIKALFEPFP